jgi:hypothetical protein
MMTYTPFVLLLFHLPVLMFNGSIFIDQDSFPGFTLDKYPKE